MSKKCKCPSSHLFPHRADKCTFSTKKSRKKTHTDSHEASPIPIPAENTTAQNELDNEANDVGSEAPTVEEPELPLATSFGTNELSAAQEVAASNLLLVNGNEQCDCIAYRFKKHRKKKCSWKTHATVGLATASVIAGTIVLATVLADDGGSEKNDGSAGNGDSLQKKTNSRSKNAAVGLATATIVAGTAVLATVVVNEVQNGKVEPKQSDNSSLPAGVNNMHLHTTNPETSSTETKTADLDDATPSTTEEQEDEALEEEEPESEVEEEEESEEDLEARLQASDRADFYEAMRQEREANAAILRARRVEAQRLEKERQQQQQQQPEGALC